MGGMGLDTFCQAPCTTKETTSPIRSTPVRRPGRNGLPSSNQIKMGYGWTLLQYASFHAQRFSRPECSVMPPGGFVQTVLREELPPGPGPN